MQDDIMREIVTVASTSSSVLVTEELPGLMEGFEIFIESVTIGEDFFEIEGNDNSIRILKESFEVAKNAVDSYTLSGVSSQITLDLDFVPRA